MNTFLGKYEIIEELGRGGFGIVYKVRDTVLEVERALKVLHPVLVADTTFLARFKQEAQLAAKLEAPNLVPVYDFGEDDGRFYLVMKYMSGGSLKDLLDKKGRLEEQEAFDILEQAGRGVDYAHAHGVIHRDLKPRNLLFDQDGSVRVSDMGFAKSLSGGSGASLSISGGMVGTPAYMAPEIWRGKPATPSSDIYSMGCILYEMLTGAVLFDGDSPADVMTKHVLDGPVINKSLKDPIKKVIMKAIEKDPLERYKNLAECDIAYRRIKQAKEQININPSTETGIKFNNEKSTSTSLYNRELETQGSFSHISLFISKLKTKRNIYILQSFVGGELILSGVLFLLLQYNWVSLNPITWTFLILFTVIYLVFCISFFRKIN